MMNTRGIFHGEVVKIRDVITFQGRSVAELKVAFRDSVELEVRNRLRRSFDHCRIDLLTPARRSQRAHDFGAGIFAEEVH